MRWRAPSGVAMEAVSVTCPSPGETIKPSPAGMAREDRGKTRGKTRPAGPGRCPSHRLPVNHLSGSGHYQKDEPVDVTVANHRSQRLYG